MNKIKKLIPTFILLFLVGCASMNSKFDCPNKPGVTCRSIDQVNDMIDKGQIGREGSIKTHPTLEDKFYALKSSSGRIVNSPLRSGERVVRIWMAPYQDVNNNYHGEGEIYTVVHKNSWLAPYEITEANCDAK